MQGLLTLSLLANATCEVLFGPGSLPPSGTEASDPARFAPVLDGNPHALSLLGYQQMWGYWRAMSRRVVSQTSVLCALTSIFFHLGAVVPLPNSWCCSCNAAVKEDISSGLIQASWVRNMFGTQQILAEDPCLVLRFCRKLEVLVHCCEQGDECNLGLYLSPHEHLTLDLNSNSRQCIHSRSACLKLPHKSPSHDRIAK